MGSIGAYGLTIPIYISNIDIPNMVDISYVYHETRSYDSITKADFKHLDSSVLTVAERVQEGTDVDNVVVEHLLNTQPIVVHSLEYHLIAGGIDSYVAMIALAVLEHYCVTFQHFSQSLDSCLWQWLLFNFLQVFIIDFF